MALLVMVCNDDVEKMSVTCVITYESRLSQTVGIELLWALNFCLYTSTFILDRYSENKTVGLSSYLKP